MLATAHEAGRNSSQARWADWECPVRVTPRNLQPAPRRQSTSPDLLYIFNEEEGYGTG
jgi:hypothetical protein